MPRRLKVFQSRFGFWDCVVAAPSRAAALRAWGTRQNLFAEGEAHEVTDETVVAAAIAHPETPLRRALGTNDAFSLEPRLPQLPEPARASPSSARPKPPPAPAKPPDRRALNAAEAKLRRLVDEQSRQAADFEHRRAALHAEEAAAARLSASAISSAKEEVQRHRVVFMQKGGKG